MLSFKKYLFMAGFITGGILLVIAAFNAFVDPYDFLGNNRTAVYYRNERQIKDIILKYRHEGVLIGSSKTGYIDPDGLSCYRFYNASMRGMVPEEMYYYLKKYLRDEKLLLIGFDFYMFNEREFPLIRISDWDDLRYRISEYLLGVHTIDASVKTLQRWRKGEPPDGMKQNGQFAYPGLASGKTSVDSRQDEKKYNDIIRGLVRHHYGNFSYSHRRMAYVRDLKVFLDSRKIRYAVFINPYNLDVFNALQRLEAYSTFLIWKKEMKEIFPDLYDFSYGPYSGREKFYSDDPYHYTNAAGWEFLNRIIGDYCPNASKP